MSFDRQLSFYTPVVKAPISLKKSMLHTAITKATSHFNTAQSIQPEFSKYTHKTIHFECVTYETRKVFAGLRAI